MTGQLKSAFLATKYSCYGNFVLLRDSPIAPVFWIFHLVEQEVVSHIQRSPTASLVATSVNLGRTCRFKSCNPISKILLKQ